MIIAHKSSNEEIAYREQSLKQHLENVESLCSIYACEIGLKSCGALIGYLHDIGKATDAFQTYIKSDEKLEKVDHSTAGAIFVMQMCEKYKDEENATLTAEIIALVIMSHHSGLLDIYDENAMSPFLNRLCKIENDTYNKNFEEVKAKSPDFFDVDKAHYLFKKSIEEMSLILNKYEGKCIDKNFYISMICKCLYSCLIDADRYDTACFCDNFDVVFEEYKTDFSMLSDIFESNISKLKSNSKINKLRKILSDNCYKNSAKSTGVYTLNCPTGSGKTLSSFRFAFNHASKNNKTRIFYIAPYITILKQNVNAIADKIGSEKDKILEIHSAKEQDRFDEDVDLKKNELLSQRLNSPIVFMSMVRFLNICFARGSKNARPLHNFANSIIIFDEIQTVSPQHIALVTGLLGYFKDICNATVLLSTATQPTLDVKISDEFPPLKLGEDCEISGCDDDIRNSFRRTEFLDKTNLKTQDEISNFILELSNVSDSVLVIVNIKSAVKQLYEKIIENTCNSVYLLTTNLYPKHRAKVLDEIKSKLGKEKIIVISTQLIEAGVDISFCSVVRSLAGLDSIIQAGGRCNRNGEFNEKLGQVYIVNPDFEKLDSLPEIKNGKDILYNMLLRRKRINNSNDNLDSLTRISNYFKSYFAKQKDNIKYKLKDENLYLYDLLSQNSKLKDESESNLGIAKNSIKLTQSFKLAEENFRAIENFGKSVIVSHNDSVKLIDKLKLSRNFKEKNQILKELQQYTVNLFGQKNAGIEYIEDYGVYILKEGYYDEVFGVSTQVVVKEFYY